MTLLITELSSFGIAMIADSAVTSSRIAPSGQVTQRVLYGAQKLQVIPYLNAGISTWGVGNITAVNGGSRATDEWLSDFIERNSHLTSIDAFAQALVYELRSTIGSRQKTPLGFHIAGYVEINGKKLPTFYHTRNVEGTFRGYDYHDFITGQDFPPQEIAPNSFYLTRNGDYGAYALLISAIEMTIPIVQAMTDITIPSPSLEGRIAYHAAWVRFISDLYGSAKVPRRIGGNVSSLGIYPTGQLVFASGS